ncbi:MAG: hypothetical protein HJJLKODD_02068 [Phycisphaerae bacterium]|nr:hypothetical protein [Phycisphaerae bacterium]
MSRYRFFSFIVLCSGMIFGLSGNGCASPGSGKGEIQTPVGTVKFEFKKEGENVTITRTYPDGTTETRTIPASLIEKMCGKLDPESVAFQKCVNALLGEPKPVPATQPAEPQQREGNGGPILIAGRGQTEYLTTTSFMVSFDGLNSSDLLEELAVVFDLDNGTQMLDELSQRYTVGFDTVEGVTTMTLLPLPGQEELEIGFPKWFVDFMMNP